MVPYGPQPSSAISGLSLEARITLGQNDPSLHTAGPEVDGWP
jgi:hypothetical protein